MSSPKARINAAEQQFKTPHSKEAASEEDEEATKFAVFGLSPPPAGLKHSNTFGESEKKIRADFTDKWENGEDEEKKILLFLHSRGFLDHFSRSRRKSELQEFLPPGPVRKRMMLVVGTEGDVDKAETSTRHYVSTCTAIHRYFQQQGARGFVQDMSSLTYYLRNQKYGSCFLQGACVCISYLLHTYRKHVPPPDASQFIRHNFTYDQLHTYAAKDDGGDSVAIYKLLVKQFFDCDFKSFPLTSLPCSMLLDPDFKDTMKKGVVTQGPCLVSKFQCSSFSVDREPEDKRCGYVRFTEWGKKGEFVPLERPSDEDIAGDATGAHEKVGGIM